MKIRKRIFILLMLFNFCPFGSQGQTLSRAEVSIEEAEPMSPQLVLRESERVKFSRMQKLMGILGIKSGMTIVDIGAGSGQYTYKFAERLKGTGRVFATDIDPDMIKYVKQEAKQRGFSNVFPVLVKSEGLDEFYTKEKFDLVFVANTYFYMHDRTNFFKSLKGSLSQDGRLVVLEGKYCPKIFLRNISNVDGLIKKLSSKRINDPFYLLLRESTRQLLQQPSKDKELLRKAIIVDFSRMIQDIHFLSHFLKDGLNFKEGMHFSIDERTYVDWVLRFLRDEEKILDNKGVPDIGKMSGKDIFLMRVVNAVIIIQEFRKYLFNGKPAPYLPGGYIKHGNIIKELSSAGYSLKYQYDFIPFNLIQVFFPNKNAD